MNAFDHAVMAFGRFLINCYEAVVGFFEKYGKMMFNVVVVSSLMIACFFMGACYHSRTPVEGHPYWKGYPGVVDEPIVINPGARIPIILDPNLDDGYYAWYYDQAYIMANPTAGTDRLTATLIHEWGHHLASTSVRFGWSEAERQKLAILIRRCLEDINQDYDEDLPLEQTMPLFVSVDFERWRHFFISNEEILGKLPESVRQLVRDNDLAEQAQEDLLLELLREGVTEIELEFPPNTEVPDIDVDAPLIPGVDEAAHPAGCCHD